MQHRICRLGLFLAAGAAAAASTSSSTIGAGSCDSGSDEAARACPRAAGLIAEGLVEGQAAYLLQRDHRAVNIDHRGNDDLAFSDPEDSTEDYEESGGGSGQVPDCTEESEVTGEPCIDRGHRSAWLPPGSGATAPARASPVAAGPKAGDGRLGPLSSGKDFTVPTSARSPHVGNASALSSKVGINLSTKWMAKPMPAAEAISMIVRIQRHLGLSRPIQRVKTFDLSPTNVEIINILASNSLNIKELVIGIGNLELATFDVSWLQGIANRFGGDLHIAVGNEPDREGVHGSLVQRAIGLIKHAMPDVQVTVPFAYSIMGRSYPVDLSEFRKEFLDEYAETLASLDYLTINIYPFLTAGVKNVPLESLKGPEMTFLSTQLAALRVAIDKVQSHNRMPVAIGETGWPSCGAARWHPYNFAVLSHSQEYIRNVAHWIESEVSAERIVAGYLFTAFDEETKGTREIERHYGILASDGSFKRPESCRSNATEPAVAWLETDYPDCESDLDWMVKNFENVGLMEKFANRGIDGSLCSFQQYLSERWGSCPPIARIPGQVLFDGAHMAYGAIGTTTKCNSPRLAHKYSDRSPTTGPDPYKPRVPARGLPGVEDPAVHGEQPGPLLRIEPAPRIPPPVVKVPVVPLADTGLATPAEGAPAGSITDNTTPRPLLPKATAEGRSPSGRVLKVFWINMDASADRREAFEASLRDLAASAQARGGATLQATRVPAVTAEDVSKLARNGSLSVEAQLIDGCTVACPTHHLRGELLKTEMAVTLSHLRAVDMAHASGDEIALIVEDDARIQGELLTDLASLLEVAPTGWSALQLATVSSKALLLLASAAEPFKPREERFYGTGAYLIRRSGMERLRLTHGSRRFRRPLSPESAGASSLQAEPLIFGALPAGTVHTATTFYVNFVEFPTTVHLMTENSSFYTVNSIKWQAHFLEQHRRSAQPREPRYLDGAVARLPTGGTLRTAADATAGKGPRIPSFLAMTTLVCRRNPSFFGEVNSIVRSINALEAYHFNWTIFAVVQDKFKKRACPGLHRYPEFKRPEVRLAFRESPGRFSKWVYYTEDIDTIDRFDFLIVFDADMGLATFQWEDFFGRYQTYSSRWSAAPVVGIVRNRSPFFPLRSDWWQDCGRKGVRYVEADFVEQWFAMLSGAFAAWFLRRVVQVGLIAEQKSLGVDWGVDAAWCGAAAEWSGKEAGCLLVPMDMYHGDTKSLKQDITFHKRGEHLNNLWWLRLPKWMKSSEIWLGTFFQDPGVTCSPCGLEERYHIKEDLRNLVPVVPTSAPGANLHMEEGEADDSASASAYGRRSAAVGARPAPLVAALAAILAALVVPARVVR